MDDQLDNELKKRITEVFENYEDTSADEGWLKLREKFPEEKKRRVAAWYWAGIAAALLLLFLGILWFKKGNIDESQLVTKQTPVKGHQQAPEIAKENRKADSKYLPDSANAPKSSLAQNSGTPVAPKNKENTPGTPTVSRERQEAIAAVNRKNINGNALITAKSSLPHAVKAPSKSQAIAGIRSANNIAQANPQNTASKPGIIASLRAPDNNSLPVTQNVAKNKIDSVVQNPSQAVAANPKGIDMRKEDQAKASDKKSIEDMFRQDKQVAETRSKKTSKEDKAINVGVYAATYFNYAKGSTNQFNLGAGITSDVKLTRNLKLSTGVSVGQNTMTYAGQPPQQASYNAIAVATTSNFSPAKMLYTASAPTFKDYSANLVGLDIPLNLKFVFDPQKSGTYILAGVSSGTFINETYTYSYSTPSLYSSNVSQVQNQSTKDSFNGFYFAKTLNLAFGTGYTVGRSQLVVEPFMKYPLAGLGSQQLKFGAGGVNLKFNFQVKKK
ncbi:hypothetical protein [Mucilaginibacter ginsenosidivorans]|uniref:PorT family protein n=1 Tax=Mucilaginibacter ginsenosidivorans TaxID=398053 RepID=A0A5B8V1P4_9SPHI|nr:hypothetical protein [Mucilaginibacter ginsenosidivorans]QEC64975.1 hypothetical protein FRZ54_21180 [Mucilaginibacter ginsenosidivorans]